MINFAINAAIGAGIGIINDRYTTNPDYKKALIVMGAVAAVALTVFTAAHATKLLVIAALASLVASDVPTEKKVSAATIGVALGVLFSYILPVPGLGIGSNGLNLIWII